MSRSTSSLGFAAAAAPTRRASTPVTLRHPIWEVDPVPEWDALLPRTFYVRRGRRAFDLALVALLLPLLGPAALVVAGANWLAFRDVHKILFVQERIGHRGRPFRMLKFRTMRDAPQGELSSWRSGADRARVTPLGRFLRSTHLDEIPQLWNILRGDMAIIGPRPEMTDIEEWAAREVPGFSRRLAMRPGVTGLAQITQGYTGNDVPAYAEKARICERYMQTVTLRGDLWICARTAWWMLRGKGWGWRAQARTNATE